MSAGRRQGQNKVQFYNKGELETRRVQKSTTRLGMHVLAHSRAVFVTGLSRSAQHGALLSLFLALVSRPGHLCLPELPALERVA